MEHLRAFDREAARGDREQGGTEPRKAGHDRIVMLPVDAILAAIDRGVECRGAPGRGDLRVDRDIGTTKRRAKRHASLTQESTDEGFNLELLMAASCGLRGRLL